MDIAPAIQMGDPSGMTAEEFQHQLCSWLDNRGMLMELRAYLKSNMIEILRNTSSGTSLRLKSNVRLSPKMQALNFLISEYLAHCEYYFSLSVFATEVAMFSNVPKDKHFKFGEEEVYDILEALGIMRHNKQAMCIYFMYKDGNEPLLTYFLPSPPVFSGSRAEVEGFYTILDSEFDFAVHNITKILVNSNLLPEEINQLKYYIKWIAEKHKEREHQLESTLKIEFKLQLSKYKVKIHDLEKAHHLERKILECKLEDVRDKLIILSKREQEENARLRERNEQEKRLKTIKAEKPYVSRLPTKVKPRETITRKNSLTKIDAAVSTDVIQETKSSQWNPDECDAEKLKTQLEAEREIVRNVSAENDILRKTVQKFAKENDGLKTENAAYCKQLEELGKRATTLMNELSISQMNMLRLSGVLSSVSEGNGIPPPSMTSQQMLAFTGAGEEYVRTSNVIPPQFRHLTRTSRTKKQNVKSASSSSCSRSPSPTESVLQNARERLKHLEEESDAIERRIHQIHIPKHDAISTPELAATTPQSSLSETSESTELGFRSTLANITSRGSFLSAKESMGISS